MPKIPLNGFIEEVGNVHFVGQNNTAKQEILLRVPAYRDEFGETKGPDDYWKIAIMGDKIDRFNIHSRHVGSRVKSEVFVNSRQYTSKKDNTVGYMVNVTLATIDFAAAPAGNHARQASPNTVAQDQGLNDPAYQQQRSEEEDDLPF